MQPISRKTGFLMTFLAIASLGGMTACSNASQNQAQAPSTPTTEPSGKQDMMQGGGMNHGNGMMQGNGMNHSMAMDLGPADENYDLRFIDGMIPHHRGAIAMAKEAQQKSTRPEIKKLADDIIISQSREENELMRKWRTAWYPKAGDKPMAYNAQMNHTMEMSSEQMQAMMMSQDLGKADTEFDLRFINAMIPHHEEALIMAEDALKKSKRPEIKKLAQEILTSQQKEIDLMKQWKQAWYKQ
ncbi:MAG: DUF305 domain-containing protein [Coleofasciculaceae cyanobacterium]